VDAIKQQPRHLHLRQVAGQQFLQRLAVWATNRRESADFDVALAVCSTAAPTGSAACRWRRVASPASIRSSTT
jgi:hypothetical protein